VSEAVGGEKRIGEKKAVNKLPASGDNMSSTIEYLTEKEEWDTTQEILSDGNAMKNIKEAAEAWKDKREEEFSSWDAVRKDV